MNHGEPLYNGIELKDSSANGVCPPVPLIKSAAWAPSYVASDTPCGKASSATARSWS